MNVVLLQFTLRNQRRLHGTKLCALRDTSFGEYPTQEAVDVEDQRQACTGLGHHRPVRDGVQRPMLQTHRLVGTVTLFTP